MVDAAELTDDEREAIHEIERGTEWIHRAHGDLVELHHAVGRAMEHYEAAADALADEHDGLADRLEAEVLPAGLTEAGHLSYELVREFEGSFLAGVEAVHDDAVDELADGERYVVEAARHADAGDP
jgi:hypothetical protein